MITESQNGWCGKVPLEIIQFSPTGLAGPPPCPDSFCVSPRAPQPPWAPGARSQSSVTVKICLLVFRGNLFCFSVFPLTLILSRAPLKIAWLCPPFLYLWTLTRSFWAFSRLHSHRSLSPSSLERSSIALIICVASCWTLFSVSLSLLWWVAQNWTHCSRWGFSRAE